MNNHFTGHTHHNSPYECDDNCGTCDGARCETCREYWTIDSSDKRFFNKEEAEQAERAYESLIPLDPSAYTHLPGPTDYYMDGLKLMVSMYVSDELGHGYRDIECNSDSPLFLPTYTDAAERKSKFQSCKCVDKTSSYCQNDSCEKFGCIDTRCYSEMCNKGRTEKKRYDY